MKTRTLVLILALLFLPSMAYGQGSRFDGVAQRTVQGFLAPIPGATITVCTSVATGIPCSPTTTIYLDQGLTQPAPNPFQADSNGNFGFWIGPGGSYKYSITAAGVTGSLSTVAQIAATGCVPGSPVNALQKNSGGACTASGLIDDGTTVTEDRDHAFKGPNPYFDVTRYGARAFLNAPSSTTATCVSGNTAVTLAAAIDFIIGDGIVLGQCGPSTALTTPAAPSAVAQRAVINGATTRSYKVVAEDFQLGLTAASAATSIANGAATLGAINAATTTGYTASGGLVTYTTSAAHNLSPGARILFGTTGGVYQVVSTPSGTTFTITKVNQRDVPVSVPDSQSVNVESHIQVYWTNQANMMRWWIYRQDGGAGNFNLVGVQESTEPFYDDKGFTAPSAPSYVPLTAPASATKQSLATTIVSGAGTASIVVANTPSTSVAGVAALHDSTVGFNAAITAAQAIAGGRAYIPKAPSGQSFPINFPWVQPFSNAAQTQIEFMGPISASQPVVFQLNTHLQGVGDTAGGRPNFSRTYYAKISGSAYPLVQAYGGENNISHVLINATLPQQSALVAGSPINFGNNGPVTIDLTNSYIQGTTSGAAMILSAVGFDFRINDNVFVIAGAPVFYANPAFRLMGSSISVPTGIPGIGTFEDNTLIGKGIGVDTQALNGAAIANVGSPWSFSNIFTEATCGPVYDLRNISSQNWFNWTIGGWTQIADEACGTASVVDMTGSGTLQSLKISGIGGGTYTAFYNVTGNSDYLRTEGPNDLHNATDYSGDVATSANYGSGVRRGRSFETDMGLRLKGIAAAFAVMQPPTNLTGTAVAGGALTIANHTWQVTAVDWNGAETVLGNQFTLTISAPNQTVNLTWVAPTGNPQGYYVYRDLLRVIGGITTGLAFSDVGAVPSGASPPIHSGAGVCALNVNGVFCPLFRVTSAGGFKADITAPTLTANRSIVLADGAQSTVLVANFTTAGATTSDVITVQGMTASGHCLVSPSNALAATGFVVGTTWLDTPGSNAITLHHTNTNGQIFTIACTPN